MFVVEVGQHPHDRAPRPGARRQGRGARRLHPRGGRSGSGSPCSSPTSPRRWPRAAARPRPTRCARCARTPWRKRRARARGATPTARSSPRVAARARATSSLVEAGDLIPADGEIVEGVASVDESAITGESAPVIRETGGDRSAVTGGTRVLSDWLIVRDHRRIPAKRFLDRMIALVEGAKRQKTPNEIALDILLAALTHHLPGRRPSRCCPTRSSACMPPGRARRHRHRARGPARLPDPHHHRRPALAPSASPAWTA